MKKRINLSASSLVGEMEGLGGPLGARGGGSLRVREPLGARGGLWRSGKGLCGLGDPLEAWRPLRIRGGPLGVRGPLETGGGPLWVWWTFVDGGGPSGARVWLFGVWGVPLSTDWSFGSPGGPFGTGEGPLGARGVFGVWGLFGSLGGGVLEEYWV